MTSSQKSSWTKTGENRSGRRVPASEPRALSSETVRTELAKVLASPQFSRSERLSRFLRFIVEAALQNRGSEIKEYPIGVDVFDRGTEFDPKTDTIVRVEARRLRRKLDEYYESLRENPPFRIVLSKGNYVPAFIVADPDRQKPMASRRIAWVTALGLPLLLGCAVVFWSHRTEPSPPDYLPFTIAVLPFTNLSTDPDDEYLASGLVEELTTALTRVKGMKVVARSSASQAGAESTDLADVGRKLRVGWLVKGSVRRSSDRLEIAAQLIRASDDYCMWSEVFERDIGTGFGLQNEIAAGIAKALKLHIAPSIAPGIGLSADGVQARTLYLKAQYFRKQKNPQGLLKSLACLEQSVRMDPAHAPAYSALADCYAMLAFHRLVPVDDAVTKAKAAADRALSLDEDNAKAHGALAWASFFYDRNWAASEKEFTRAIELDPGWSSVRQWYAFGLVSQRRFPEAITQSMTALEIEPLLYLTSNDLAVINYYARRYDETIRLARQCLELEPGSSIGHAVLGMGFTGRGEYEEAAGELRKADATGESSNTVSGRFGNALALAGHRAEAIIILDHLKKRPVGSANHVEAAFICAGLGERDQAFDFLEQAYREHEPELAFLNVEPLFDSLHSDPRFASLVHRIGW
jgi:TolB-like protein